MHVDLYIALAGLIVGFVVGLTGMGGGALMTPILVILFKVQPLTAVSSDLVAALIMKPVGGAVHARRGNVNISLVKWLMVGSVPCAFAGVLILRMLGDNEQIQTDLKIILGVALLVACGSMLAKGFVHRRREANGLGNGAAGRLAQLEIHPARTVAIGAIGGLVVGMTSVGSGSLIIIMLLFLYPSLTASSLVGTDLVQAVPLVGAAAFGHILFGDFALGLTFSMLLGSIPGVYVGARVSARAPDILIRKALVYVLLASGLKLLNVGTIELFWVMAAIGIVWFVIPFVLHRLGIRLEGPARWARRTRDRVLRPLRNLPSPVGTWARAFVPAGTELASTDGAMDHEAPRPSVRRPEAVREL
ncbi:MAG: sulfite exporter TauE/SafE family protein [Actinomycetota bacterium]